MPLLLPDEPAPFEVVNPRGTSPFFILCDHASNRLPRAVGDLGLAPHRLEEHIAWDIGALELSRLLSRELDAPLVAANYSRLVIDNNRPLEASTSIPAVTCEIEVPGNASLDDAAKRARADEIFLPYHRTIERMLAERSSPSAILSMHSFTPSLYGKDRPWHIGVMYGRDRRLASLLLETLSTNPDLVLGDNEPYRVTDGSDYGIPVHAERANRLGVLVEVRQDLIATASGVESMGRVLSGALEQIARALGSHVAPPT
ncbi:MAG: N-formylglutamate amidohydrolase [Polyangiaceae bacterium]|nr:N-formylglutamate amidohydrolase [Polyangiaceae bacterium]